MLHRSNGTRYVTLLLAIVPCLAQNNVLNNGGFESGMTCYQYWMTSSTGVDFAGDYRFALSTDSHSGAYSAQIACMPGGTDCLRAALYTDWIPTAANQSYNFGIYAKCPAGTYAYAVAVDYATDGSMSNLLQFNCTGDWNLNQMSFQAGPSTNLFQIYTAIYGASWVRMDDITLTYAVGTTPVHTVLHPGTRNVSISGQNVKVDGSPYLALGFFDVPYSDLSTAAGMGVNTVNSHGIYGQADCFSTGQTSYLDHAYELGVNFIPDSSYTAFMNQPPAISPVVQTFAPHLANIAWFLSDEPDLQEIPWIYIPPATFITDYQNAKAQTSLPMFADFQRGSYGSTTDISPYTPSVDFWMAEPYGSDFSRVTHAINLFNSVQPRPIWLAQDDVDPTLIVPKTYWAIVNGATGIFYFNWDTFKSQPAKMASAQQAFTELSALKNVVFGTAIDTLVAAPAGVTAMSRFYQGASYILAASANSAPASGTFTVQGLPAGQTVMVLNESRTLTSTAGGFSDTFPATMRHVYTIAGKITPVITWSNPSGITFGGALSGTQLNATANVPGTFVFNPPAGTVLPVGSNQTLSAQFTPSDTTTYNSASATVQINVTGNAGPATLVVTRTLARDSNTNEVVVTIAIANTGGATATAVQVTSAKIGTTSTTTALPLSVPNIPGGGSSSVTVRFPGTVGAPKTAAVLSINGTYSGGSFGGSARVTLP